MSSGAENYREYAATTAPWLWRDGAALVSFGGNIVMLGGWNSESAPFDGQVVTNEVWTFDTTTWTKVLANDVAPVGRWTSRHTAPTFVFNGSIFIVGSDIYNGGGLGSSDVWRGSSPTSWERRTNTAAWGPRVFQVAASYNNMLWCGLGQTGVTAGSVLSDWWGSSDEGATWTRYADFPGAPRSMIYNPIEFGGELVLIGGGTYDTDAANRTYYNDVWAWNGTSWRNVLANGVAPWAGREYHHTCVFGGAACVINGFNTASGNLQEFWWSDDLIKWQSRPILWPNSHADGICVHNGDLWMGPGNHAQAKAWRVQVF